MSTYLLNKGGNMIEERLFWLRCWKIEQLCKRIEIRTIPNMIHKDKFKWIEDLNVRQKL